MSIAAKLFYGFEVMIIGLLVVFFMLALLIGFLKIMAAVFNAKKKEAPKPVEVKAPVVEPEPEPETEEVTDDAELIAVIAAAIAAFSDSDKPLVVRKVRRVSGWKNSARAEQIAKF